MHIIIDRSHKLCVVHKAYMIGGAIEHVWDPKEMVRPKAQKFTRD